ncbi:hypothetical protein HETIRDRAFT_315517 [Heterobasidion irregulare TC 32-1]|uniref:Uncharacterized protein n=1 Tax=Heterobasidion irregulare (strain TC 32-1) TaxID=747525 RepID=W4KBH2_HETIT|nr:uncharacterized protein HETIRDRAFT_315517 [Heterobasidion irregulare TC 32-1]XP_009553002.1 uncharacterized protein HETIRDRAFT_331369 [Heterobasidion irregulare TC 32-1]ETW75606.1 hypothetical protein HETIRDRAFT_331369 [Heterobasidion irregulare TC 32-1]ETW82406.1 hypothetical protein HETIRDRAFT_315517 [Heterobasidion irregulare TC 32-1]
MQTELPRIMQTVPVPHSGHMAAPPPLTLIPSSSPPNTRSVPFHPKITSFAPTPLTPTGIQVLMTTGQKREEQEQRYRDLADTIAAAFNTLRDTHIACFVRGVEDWQEHSMTRCKHGVCSLGDSDWQQWQANALRLSEGWCYKCCVPQKSTGGWHSYVKKDMVCPDANLIKAAIYVLWTYPPTDFKLTDCEFVIPECLGSLNAFQDWLLEAPRDMDIPPKTGFNNMLRLFVWLLERRQISV